MHILRILQILQILSAFDSEIINSFQQDILGHLEIWSANNKIQVTKLSGSIISGTVRVTQRYALRNTSRLTESESLYTCPMCDEQRWTFVIWCTQRLQVQVVYVCKTQQFGVEILLNFFFNLKFVPPTVTHGWWFNPRRSTAQPWYVLQIITPVTSCRESIYKTSKLRVEWKAIPTWHHQCHITLHTVKILI